MDASRIQRVRERTSDMVLPDEFVELARSPFTGKNEIAHGTSGYPVAEEEAARARIPPAPGAAATAAPFRA